MNRNDWIRTLWAQAGIPLGPNDPVAGVPINVLCGVVWIESEGSSARNNPLDTEQPWPGATNYNSAGVKNYVTTQDGWSATITTLFNGYYTALVHELRNPRSAEDTISFIYSSPWGSKPTDSLLNIVRDHWPLYADAYVSGTGQTPIPPPPIPIPAKEIDMFVAGTPTDNGYWECKPEDGSVYAYGDAIYFGGLNNFQGKNVMVPGDVVTDFTSCKTKQGYWIITQKGHIYDFGGAPYLGSVA